jgi:hypothetical protein
MVTEVEITPRMVGVRAYNRLTEYGSRRVTLDELNELSDSDLLNRGGLGYTSLQVIHDALAKHGYPDRTSGRRIPVPKRKTEVRVLKRRGRKTTYGTWTCLFCGHTGDAPASGVNRKFCNREHRAAYARQYHPGKFTDNELYEAVIVGGEAVNAFAKRHDVSRARVYERLERVTRERNLQREVT